MSDAFRDDQRTIDVVVGGDAAELEALASSLGGAGALRDRKAKLGLTSEVVKLSRLTNGRLVRRSCLKCDARFLSLGPHNRLCGRCR